jgi:hypothetical protein
MSIYEPDQSIDTLSKRPVVVYIHTGNFLPPILNGTPNGSINDSSAVEICMQWAKRGFVVLAPSYRLGWLPTSLDAEVRRSTMLHAVYRGIQDIKSTVRFIRKDAVQNGNVYNIDADHIVLYGDETGGYVALAYATLDDFAKLIIPKFINQNTQQLYIDTLVSGNIEGFGGTKNVDNHAGYSSQVNLIINTGGALLDTSWLSSGQPPMISFQCVRDPLAPYGNGIVVVPTTNEPVVEVSGAGIFQIKLDELGNNYQFDTVTYTDPYSVAAAGYHNQVLAYMDGPFTINTGSGSGLFPFIRPLAQLRLHNETSPWQYWDSIALATAFGQQGINAHINSKQSNPDMSKAKALAYIDTIMGFSTPRIYSVLNTINSCNAGFSLFRDTSTAQLWYAVNQATGVSPLSYTWYWGDGDSSIGAYPSHTYDTAGYYNICLTITDNTGCSDTYCDSSTYIYKTGAAITISVVAQLPVGINENKNHVFNIYPNPTNNQLNITTTLQDNDVIQYQIINMLGTTVAINKAAAKNFSIDVSALSSGIYFIQLQNDSVLTVKRFVKE